VTSCPHVTAVAASGAPPPGSERAEEEIKSRQNHVLQSLWAGRRKPRQIAIAASKYRQNQPSAKIPERSAARRWEIFIASCRYRASEAKARLTKRPLNSFADVGDPNDRSKQARFVTSYFCQTL